MKRVFAAINISPGEKIIKVISQGESMFINDRIRWVNPNQLHLTIKFFGEISESSIDRIKKNFSDVTCKNSSFEFMLKGLGVFGSRYKPKVIWIGTENDIFLKEFAEQFLEVSEALGFNEERLNFVPHLTIGRISKIKNRHKLNEWISNNKNMVFQDVEVDCITLYESLLKPTGAVHKVIEKFYLSS